MKNKNKNSKITSAFWQIDTSVEYKSIVYCIVFIFEKCRGKYEISEEEYMDNPR